MTPYMQSQQTRRSQVMTARIMNAMNEKDIFPRILLVQHVCGKVNQGCFITSTRIMSLTLARSTWTWRILSRCRLACSPRGQLWSLASM
eukprot:5720765-Amphidinium_carterae.1